MKETKTYTLRLPKSLNDAVERLSKEDGTSINQFVATAVAEKVSALQTARYFEDRKARADFKAFDRIMKPRRRAAPRGQRGSPHGYSPTTVTVISRSRGASSKSHSTICCQVPVCSCPPVNGKLFAVPISALRRCEYPLLSPQRSLCL